MHWLYLRHFVCIRCKLPSQRDPRVRSFMCESCMCLHRDEARRATSEVTKAIKNGEMDRADAHACADCGKTARDWDHRDYLRPLEVVPLCKGCNIKRGTAFDSVYRPAGEVERPPLFVSTDRRRRHNLIAIESCNGSIEDGNPSIVFERRALVHGPYGLLLVSF